MELLNSLNCELVHPKCLLQVILNVWESNVLPNVDIRTCNFRKLVIQRIISILEVINWVGFIVISIS